MPDMNDPVVKAAAKVIMANDTQSPEAIKAVTAFTQKYGREALLRLVDMMRNAPSRQVQGPTSGGMGDDIPAVIDGVQRADITSGEMVVSNPDLAAMGDGDRDVGADRLAQFIEETRQQHYGSKKHPKEVDMDKAARKAMA